MPVYKLEIQITGKNDAGPALSGLSNALKDIGKIAGGVIVAQGLSRITGGIMSMGKSAVNAASELQTLSVGLTTLVAKEAVLAGAFESVDDAIENVSGNVQKLNQDLRELALTNLRVFDFDTIAATFRLNMAYGATVDLSKQLTVATLNTSAALGLTQEMVSRLTYNLSQALIAGDLTMINLRQIKLAGLDLAKVLEGEMAMSLEEIREGLKSGTISLQDLSDAFINFADKNFAGAAERMKNTLAGVTASFKNLFFFAAADLLTPSIEAITGALNKLFDQGKGLLDSGLFRAIGEGLGDVTQSAINAGEAFMEEWGGRLKAAAIASFQWGVNISTELAAGIVQGAVDVLVAAMNFISGLLESWLAPGSPPKIAPDIDKWGAAAFTEWLRGFGDAEWDIFESLQGQLEGALNALFSAGSITGEEFGTTMITMSKKMARALKEFADQGILNKGIFRELRQIGGEFGKELELLARKQFRLVAASKEYEKVTKAFEESQKAQEKARKELEKLTSQYDELVATRAPKILVRQKQAEMDAAKARLDSIDEEVKKNEKAKNVAERRMNSLKDQVRFQSKIIDQLKEVFRWNKKIADSIEDQTKKVKAPKAPKVAKPKAGKGAAGLPAGIKIPEFKPMFAGIDTALEEFKEKLRNMIPEEARANIEKIGAAIDKLKAAWQRFKAAIGDLYERYIQPIIDGLKKVIPPGLIEDLGWAIGVFLTFKAALLAVGVVAGIIGAIIGSISLPIVLIIGALTLLKTAWDNNWGGIQEKTDEAMKAIKSFWETKLRPALEDIKLWLEEKVVPAIKKAWEWLDEKLTSAFTKVKRIYEEELRPAWDSIYQKLTEEVIPQIQKMYDWLFTKITFAFAWIKLKWETVLRPAWDELYEDFGKVLDVINDIWKQVTEKLLWAFDQVKKWWDGDGGDLFRHMLEIMGGIASAIKNAVDWLKQLIGLQNTLAGLPIPMNPIPPVPTPQHLGGYWPAGGIARLHANEVVLPLNNAAGLNALSHAMERALNKSNGGMNQGNIVIQNLTVQSNNAADLVQQLQSYTIPGKRL